MKNILSALVLSVFATATVFAADGKFSTSLPSATAKGNHITVMGTGNLEVDPDMATIDLTIMTRSSVSRDAQNENAVLTKRLTTAINEKYRGTVIKTTSYSVQPEYLPDDPKTITGFVVRHSLSIRFNFVEGLGDAVDLAIESGATNIDYIQFGLQNQKDYELQTLKLAMQDSLSKATAIAESAGRKIIRVVKVSEGQYSVGSDKDAAQDREEGTEIYPRIVNVSATLTVTYEF